jgi:hypothetical protein
VTSSAFVPGFRPSEHGFAFANRFPSAPAIRIPLGPLGTVGIGDVADGLCGGMCLLARASFVAGRRLADPPLAAPTDGQPPAPDSLLMHRLVDAQIASLRALRTPIRLYSLQAFRPERHDPVWSRLGRRTRSEESVREWRRIRERIDQGRLAFVGIVRTTGPNPFDLVHQHQVLAYGYEVEGDRLRLRIYDPNHPGRDDVELRLRLGIGGRGPVTMLQTTGEPVEAFCLLG